MMLCKKVKISLGNENKLFIFVHKTSSALNLVSNFSINYL